MGFRFKDGHLVGWRCGSYNTDWITVSGLALVE